MSSFIEVLQEAERTKEQIAIATIVAVEGSAYRRAGAKMLFLKSGRSYGTLSAGCLESDLSYRAEETLQNRTSQLLVYDMSSEDDFTWGRGTGCNGVIHVLLECADFRDLNATASFWSDVLKQLNKGKTAVICRELLSDGDSGHYLIAEESDANGQWRDDNRDGILEDLRRFSANDGSPYTAQIVDDEMRVIQNPLAKADSGQSHFYFFDKIQPKDRLFIFGAGPDAEPMVDILGQVGFDVTVVDHRPARLDNTLFPRAKKLIDARPSQAESRVQIPEGSYVIIMTHSFQDDKVWTKFLKGKTLRYLGILGPRQRTERVLPEGFKTTVLHSPIGLNIHADGPEEIAVAVAAELIQARQSSTAQWDQTGSQSDAPFADRSVCQYPYLDTAP